ncbi:MAG: hypothetical protein WA496_02955 [Candidatus Udaeobacter sp.]
MNAVIDLSTFQNLPLRGDFTIVRLELTNEPIADAIGREARARTRIVGRGFDLLIRAGLSQRELSVTLYHEILEAAKAAIENPPAAVRELNEGDFDRAAYQAHEQFGEVSPQNLDQMLQLYGF